MKTPDENGHLQRGTLGRNRQSAQEPRSLPTQVSDSQALIPLGALVRIVLLCLVCVHTFHPGAPCPEAESGLRRMLHSDT